MLTGVDDVVTVFSYKSDFLLVFQTDCDLTNLLSIKLFDLGSFISGALMVGKISIHPLLFLQLL